MNQQEALNGLAKIANQTVTPRQSFWRTFNPFAQQHTGYAGGKPTYGPRGRKANSSDVNDVIQDTQRRNRMAAKTTGQAR